MKDERWVNKKEVAIYLGLSDTTIQRMIRDNRIPVHRIGVQWRFKLSEIDAYFMNQELPKTKRRNKK